MVERLFEMVTAIQNKLINSSPMLVLLYGPMAKDMFAVTVQGLHLWDILLSEKREYNM